MQKEKVAGRDVHGMVKYNRKLKNLETAIYAPRTKGRIRSIRTAFKEYQADKKWGWLKRTWKQIWSGKT